MPQLRLREVRIRGYKMDETLSKRISQLIQERGLTPEELSYLSDISPHRIGLFLKGMAPEEEEIPNLAQALRVYEVELKHSLAGRFGRFLRANDDYWSFPRTWPTVESRTGQRAQDIDEPEADQELFEDVLDEYQKGQVWYNYGRTSSLLESVGKTLTRDSW